MACLIVYYALTTVSEQNVPCSFNDIYICGYKSLETDSYFWKRYDEALHHPVDMDHTNGKSSAHLRMLGILAYIQPIRIGRMVGHIIPMCLSVRRGGGEGITYECHTHEWR